MADSRLEVVGVSSFECRGVYKISNGNTRILLGETPAPVVVHSLRCGVTNVLCPRYTNNVESKCGASDIINDRTQCPYRQISPTD